MHRDNIRRQAGRFKRGSHHGPHGGDGRELAQRSKYLRLQAEIVGDPHEMVELNGGREQDHIELAFSQTARPLA